MLSPLFAEHGAVRASTDHARTPGRAGDAPQRQTFSDPDNPSAHSALPWHRPRRLVARTPTPPCANCWPYAAQRHCAVTTMRDDWLCTQPCSGPWRRPLWASGAGDPLCAGWRLLFGCARTCETSDQLIIDLDETLKAVNSDGCSHSCSIEHATNRRNAPVTGMFPRPFGVAGPVDFDAGLFSPT
jgi:hypothetical protein